MYLHYNKKTIETDNEDLITSHFDAGYVFTREGLGTMDQTRSIRIDLEKFELSSENKRIVRKTQDLVLEHFSIPFAKYDWTIGKLAKDFYDTKFAPGIFSANKIKELFTDKEKTNFTTVLSYKQNDLPVGYCIAYKNNTLLHYSYPFYDLASDKNTGMGMMIKAIIFAKQSGLTYIYLGSAQRPTDIYKLQFSGLEWFDVEQDAFSSNLDRLKEILKSI